MAVEPPVIAVVRGKPLQKIGQIPFAAGQAGHTDQPALIGGEAEHQRVARPDVDMRADRDQRGGPLAGEQSAENFDVAQVAVRTSLTEGLGRGKGVAHGRDVTRELEGACFADMGQGEVWVSFDGAVEGAARAGVDGQEKVDTFDIGISRDGGASRDGETVAVCQHRGLSAKWDRWVTDEGAVCQTVAVP